MNNLDRSDQRYRNDPQYRADRDKALEFFQRQIEQQAKARAEYARLHRNSLIDQMFRAFNRIPKNYKPLGVAFRKDDRK